MLNLEPENWKFSDYVVPAEFFSTNDYSYSSIYLLFPHFS